MMKIDNPNLRNRTTLRKKVAALESLNRYIVTVLEKFIQELAPQLQKADGGPLL
jgi:hypothetical protein